jgi:hypothetical protein
MENIVGVENFQPLFFIHSTKTKTALPKPHELVAGVAV